VRCGCHQSAGGGEGVSRLGCPVDFDDVLQLAQLADELLEALVIAHDQEHHAAGGVSNRQTQNAIEIEAAAREQTADVRHDARMIADQQPQKGP